MAARTHRLAVAALMGAILLLTAAAMVRNFSDPFAPAPADRAPSADILALMPGPVDLEALPGPHPRLRPRRLMGFASLAAAIILLVVYFGWREAYILEWVAFWVCTAYGLALLSRQYPDARVARMAIGVFALLNLGGALFLLKSGWSYARQALPRAWPWGLVAIAVWLVGARLAVARPTMAMQFFLVVAALNAGTAGKFLFGLPGGRSLGAWMLGIAMAIVMASNLLVASAITAFTTDGVLVFRILALNSLAAALAAVAMHLLVFEDTTRELRKSNDRLASAQDQLKQMAITDPLTGCYNRRFIDEIAPRELERQRRYNQPLAVMFIDVDHFKSINDSRGHRVGDRVLQRVARVIREQLRQSDYVFRWGGDEFVALLECDVTEARAKGDTLKRTLAGLPLDPAPHDVPVTISVGVAAVPVGDTDLLGAITRADEAMYADKTAAQPR